MISVQVLNEFAAVASRKVGLSWTEIKDILDLIRTLCEVVPLSIETHDRGVEIAERMDFRFSMRPLSRQHCKPDAQFCIPKTCSMTSVSLINCEFAILSYSLDRFECE